MKKFTQILIVSASVILWLTFIPIGNFFKLLIKQSGANMITFNDIASCYLIPMVVMFFIAVFVFSFLSNYYNNHKF